MTDIAAHIAEVRAMYEGYSWLSESDEQLLARKLPQTIDLLEAEHERAERMKAAIRLLQENWPKSTPWPAALEAQEVRS